jgi:hypothetical protein
MPYGFISAAMIPDLHNSSSTASQQQGTNADETPALFRDLSKIRESDIGIDTTGRKENCSLTSIDKRRIFKARKATVPMLKGSTIILLLKFGLPSSSDVRWPFSSSFYRATSFFIQQLAHSPSP